MLLDIAINTHNYDRRLCWTLSSLMQQARPCQYSVTMSYVPGTMTEQVVELYGKAGMPFNRPLLQPGRQAVLDRGSRRTQMIQASKAEWIMLIDSDNVYPPDYLHRLGRALEGTHAGSKRCLVPYRRTTMLADAERLIAGHAYPCVVEDAWGRAGRLVTESCCNLGAGYCHILNVRQMMLLHGGLYQPEGVVYDRIKRPGHAYKTRSDKYLRKKTGWIKLRTTVVPEQIHLQHVRGDYSKGG